MPLTQDQNLAHCFISFCHFKVTMLFLNSISPSYPHILRNEATHRTIGRLVVKQLTAEYVLCKRKGLHWPDRQGFS